MDENFKQNDGDTVPRHRYFWIATLTNNNQVIPEYDFENLRHNRTRDLPVDKITRFSWYPVTLTMKERVWEFFHEELNISGDTIFHQIDIDVEDGERLRCHPVWRHDISFMGGSGVTTKYALFKTLKSGVVEGFFIDDNGRKSSE
jgi:hypothetical protein